MKQLVYILSLLALALSACSNHDAPKDVPFEMLPDSLKKKVEAELMDKMKNEVIEEHNQLDKYYRNSSPIAFHPENRNIFEIRRNTNKKIIIRGDSDPKESIEILVAQFYLANESLSPDQTRSYIIDFEYKFNDYPFYSSITRDQILLQTNNNRIELERAVEDEESLYVDFYEDRLHKWQNKLTAIDALNMNELKEIHPGAHIRISDQLNEKGLSDLTVEALKGLLQVRDYASRKYFDLPYMDLYFQGTRFTTPDAEKKLAAVDHLFQVNIVDLSYATLNNLLTDWYWEEPEYIPSP